MAPLSRVSRIVLAAWGSEGDVHPFIAVALALRAKGAEPVIAARESFRAAVEGEGIAFRPLRPDIADLAAFGLDEAALGAGMTDPITGMRFLVKRALMPSLRHAYEDMLAATEGADLVVVHSFAYAARLAAEVRAIPWAAAVLQPFALLSAYDPPVLGLSPLADALRPLLPPLVWKRIKAVMARTSRPWFAPLDALRAELGLPPLTGHPQFDGSQGAAATLALYPARFGPPAADDPPGLVHTGFAFHDGAARAPLDPALAAFLAEGEAPIVFTLGSAAGASPQAFFTDGLAAARALGRRAVLVGPSAPRAGEGTFTTPYAPYSKLFPAAAAIVHHGGVGTCAQALRAGRPQLIIPVMADQPDNAHRLARLGAARTLSRARATPERLRRELSLLLSRPSYAQAAAREAQAIAAEDGAQAAAEVLLEAIAR